MRFFTHIGLRLESTIIGKSTYSRSTFVHGIQCLAKRFVFEYPNFKVTPHEAAKLDAVVATFVQDGKLLKGHWRKPQFIGFLTVKKLLTSYMVRGIEHGVVSWDVHLSRWASIVFQAALNCRVGELLRSKEYKGTEFLAYEDIEMKLVDGVEFHHLQMRIKLRYEKGTK